MEGKERYEVMSPSLNGYAYIHDFKTDNVLNTYDSCDLLNQQDKENQQLKQQLKNVDYYKNYCELKSYSDDMIKGLTEQCQQLKQQLEDAEENIDNLELQLREQYQLVDEKVQQLHDLPKKIVEDCKMALIKRINIISGYGRMTIDEQSFFLENEYGKDLDTILKKFGGENE